MPTAPKNYRRERSGFSVHQAPTPKDTRPSAAERGYDSEWAKAKREYLSTHEYCVSCGCKANMVDHIIPHKGNHQLFWLRSNWQPMCRSCHSRKTAMQDGGFGNAIWGSMPTDER